MSSKNQKSETYPRGRGNIGMIMDKTKIAVQTQEHFEKILEKSELMQQFPQRYRYIPK